MRQMNQFESDDRLVEALRSLGKDSLRNAPADVGSNVATAFRRHHRSRRAKNAAIVALGVICLVSASWLLLKPSRKMAPQIARDTPSPTIVPAPAVKPAVTAKKGISRTIPRSRRKARAAPQEADDFFPLPAYDPALARSGLQIVRVEMPVQDLRLMGAPLSEEVSNRRVLTDFVVGHDGTPYAVRFVH